MSEENLEIVIPEINSKSGLNLCSGNKKIYIQSLRLFISNIPATLIKIRDVKEDNLKNYLISVHSLKGMCDYIGAQEARIKAKQLEDLADAGDFKVLQEQNENFIKQIEIIINNIQTWLDSNSNFVDKIINAGRGNG